MTENIIPHSRPTLGEEEAQAASEVVRSGYVSQGERVKEFEEKLAAFTGAKYALATNSGTSALHLGLAALGIGAEDEVILPSYVCTAPLNAVYTAGAQPKLCDIEIESFNISAENARDNITDRTKAIIVPHMFGSPADLEKLEELGVPLIEDCAHSIGAVYGKKKVGSMGRLSIMSFYANKMLACGEGGALVTDDEDIIKFARDRRDYDRKDDYKVRYNYKMTDMQAAMGIVQLGRLPEMIEKRKALAASYDKAFSGLPLKLSRGEFDHIYYRYVLTMEKDVPEAIARIKEKGVNCERPLFKPLHRYLEMRSGFRDADEAYATALSVPIYPSLTEEEQSGVIEALREALK